MKIQCDMCEKEEATVLCCADEAALCLVCDEKVHTANKLALQHQRVALLNPSSSSFSSDHHPPLPTCDICQEKVGYFFCLEDRALLCRQCDVSIHTANPYVSSHQRFLVTGVKVALQVQANSSTINNNNNNVNGRRGGRGGGHCHLSSSQVSNASSVECPADKRCCTGVMSTSTSITTTATTTTLSISGEPQQLAVWKNWPLDEILSSADFDNCCEFSNPHGSSSRSRIGYHP